MSEHTISGILCIGLALLFLHGYRIKTREKNHGLLDTIAMRLIFFGGACLFITFGLFLLAPKGINAYEWILKLAIIICLPTIILGFIIALLADSSSKR